MDILECRKLTLIRVSNCPELFKGELQKSIDALNHQEKYLLRAWCIREFGKIYPKIIVESFKILPIPNKSIFKINLRK